MYPSRRHLKKIAACARHHNCDAPPMQAEPPSMNHLDLYEVEGRAVAVDRARSRAWALSESGHWREAPGLVGKARVAGVPLTPEELAVEFPTADLTALPVTLPRLR